MKKLRKNPRKNRIDNLPFVELWADGSVKDTNPSNIGGVGVLLIHKGSSSYRLYGAHFKEKPRKATNNVAELNAVYTGLALLKKPCTVSIFTDSAYVKRGIITWQKYQRKFKSNLKYWDKTLAMVDFHNINIYHVSGHSGNLANEVAHMLAYGSAKYLTCHEGLENSLNDAYENAKKFKKTTTKIRNQKAQERAKRTCK